MRQSAFKKWFHIQLAPLQLGGGVIPFIKSHLKSNDDAILDAQAPYADKIFGNPVRAVEAGAYTGPLPSST